MKDINLRGLIEIIFKGKIIIAVITAITILLSGIASTLLAKPLYSASAVLLTNPIEKNQNAMTDEVNNLIESMGQYPEMTVETYKQQFINPIVLGNTISKLKLVDKKGNPMDKNVLANNITVSIEGNTDLLKVEVKDSDPNIAVSIANALSEEFINFISDNSKALGEQATSIIEDQIKSEKEKLEEQAKNIQDYLRNSPDIDQMKSEIDMLNDQLVSYKSDMYDVEKQISSDKDTLETFKRGQGNSSNLESDIKINIPIDADNHNDTNKINENKTDKSNQTNDVNQASSQVVLDISDNNNLQSALLTMKITEVETRLIQKIAEQKALQTEITDMESELEKKKSSLVEEEYKYNTIKRNYDLAEQTYNAYLDRHKGAIITAASNIGNSAIIISSPADISLINTSGYGKGFYLVAGAVLGFMIGIFVVIFIAYWKYSDPKENAENN